MTPFIEEHKIIISRLLVVAAFLVCLFLLVTTVVKIKEYRYIGSGLTSNNTITVSGSGSIDRSPDTAKISFSVDQESKQVKTAQEVVSAKIDAITKALIASGIEEKYIKTDSYNSYPQYDYTTGIKPSTPTIRGYQVSHAVTVSVKDLDKVEGVLGILATNNASNISGPNFGFDDDKVVVREAREKAIKDAKSQATSLAKSLGVHLVRIVSFTENGGTAPVPMYMRDMAQASGKVESAPSVPVGENHIESTITLVYEIR